VPTDYWVDLLDPPADELARHLPGDIHDRALEQLLAPIRHGDEPRPRLESQGDYVFGVFLVPVLLHEEDVVYYQEVDVILTRDLMLTVRKAPQEGRAPYDPAEVRAACRPDEGPAYILYRLVDDIAEHFLDLIDGVDQEIDELEDRVEEWTAEHIRDRISHLRHDLLHIRHTLAPTRDAIHRVLDNRVEFEGGELFTRDIELNFGDAYDKLLRASDGLELSRDLLAGVRDYHPAKIANDQNEVMTRLTVIAALVLVPTFIVGVYGQNFDNMPELHWSWGYYGWSWGVIVVITLTQLWYFRKKRWL
jgi:magnesium transporter